MSFTKSTENKVPPIHPPPLQWILACANVKESSSSSSSSALQLIGMNRGLPHSCPKSLLYSSIVFQSTPELLESLSTSLRKPFLGRPSYTVTPIFHISYLLQHFLSAINSRWPNHSILIDLVKPTMSSKPINFQIRFYSPITIFIYRAMYPADDLPIKHPEILFMSKF